MTRIYTLYWSWYEEHHTYQFTHPDNKTQEEFEKDCRELIVKYGKEYIEHEKSWVGASYWIEYIAPKLLDLGYEHIDQVNWGFFGCFILHHDEGYKSEPNDEDKDWEQLVGKELFELGSKKNTELRIKMDEDREERKKEKDNNNV